MQIRPRQILALLAALVIAGTGVILGDLENDIARASGEVITFDGGTQYIDPARSVWVYREGSMEVLIPPSQRANSGLDGDSDAEAKIGGYYGVGIATIQKQDGSPFRISSIDVESKHVPYYCPQARFRLVGHRVGGSYNPGRTTSTTGVLDLPGFSNLERVEIIFQPDRWWGNCATFWIDNIVVVEPANQPPVADAGPDLLFEANTNGGATFRLYPHGTYDPDGDSIFYTWSANGAVIATRPYRFVTLPLGTTTVNLSVSDPNGATDTDSFEVIVRDTTPPIVTTQTVDPAFLWPPNHKLVEVGIEIVALDLGTASPSVVLTGVSSSEPDNAPGDSDGETVDDVQGAIFGDPDFDVLLRAERDEDGVGRTYTLDYLVSDDAGNSTTASVEVFVPLNRSALK